MVQASKTALFGSGLFRLFLAIVVPFVSRNVHVASSTLDKLLGNLAYPLYLFHWIPRERYYRLCENNSSSLARAGLLMANFTVVIGGATLIWLVLGQPMDRLRAKWVASRRLRAEDSPALVAIEGAAEKANT
jgi:peptidoglycan/LPS O-acetylase OafA/YrhL